MACERLDMWLDGYLQDSLTPTERDDYERHLPQCPVCTDELAAYRRTETFLASVALPSMSDTFWRRQRMAIAKSIKPRVVWQAPAMSLVLFAVVLAAYLYAGLDWVVISIGDYLGLAGADTQHLSPVSFDAFDTVILLYVGLFSLALMVFLSDSDDRRRVAPRRNT